MKNINNLAILRHEWTILNGSNYLQKSICLVNDEELNGTRVLKIVKESDDSFIIEAFERDALTQKMREFVLFSAKSNDQLYDIINEFGVTVMSDGMILSSQKYVDGSVSLKIEDNQSDGFIKKCVSRNKIDEMEYTKIEELFNNLEKIAIGSNKLSGYFDEFEKGDRGKSL